MISKTSEKKASKLQLFADCFFPFLYNKSQVFFHNIVESFYLGISNPT